MKHHPRHEFVGTPHRGSNGGTEAEMTRSLRKRFRTHERARAEAQRHDSDPRSLAQAFANEIELSRSELHAVLRSEALTDIGTHVDQIGSLTVTSAPEEADHHVLETGIKLERVFAERRRDADQAKGVYRNGVTAYNAWADMVGAKPKSTPWSSSSSYALTVSAWSLVETFLVSEFLRGPPIVGVPQPLMLGLIFAAGSLFIGGVAAVGHMLVTDKRRAQRVIGTCVFVLAFCAWAALCLTGAHMRLCIEEGGSGTVAEILASIHKGLFRPFVSPMALLLAVASTATAAFMWFKSVAFWGLPFGHRQKDQDRRRCIDQLHQAEDSHKLAVKATAASGYQNLDALEARAWQPAMDALGVEREITLIVAHTRESERAVQRAHAVQLTEFGNTFRRVRPGVNIGDILVLGSSASDSLSEPESLRTHVEHLEQSATVVSGAVRRGKLRLRAQEVGYLDRVRALYVDALGTAANQGLLPSQGADQ